MKKFLSLLLCGVMILGLVGCGKGNTNSNNSEKNQNEETKSKEIEAVNYGEYADSGNWNIKINNVEETQEIKGHEESENIKTE